MPTPQHPAPQRKKRPKPQLDTVYCVQLDDTFNGLPCFKLGATSAGARLWARFAEIRTKSGIRIKPVLHGYVGPAVAPQLEEQMLAIGLKTQHTGWQGHKEVRALTEAEYHQVLDLIRRHTTKK